jgi:hypothetical protein
MAESLWSLLAHFTAPIVIEFTAEFTKLNPLQLILYQRLMV